MNYEKANNNNAFKGFIILLNAGFLYSLYGVFSRIIGNSIPQFFQVWTRGIIISLLIIAIVFISKITLKKIPRDHWRWIIVVSVSSGLLVPSFFIAINNLAIGTTLFMFYALTTIVGYTLGKFVLGERLSRIKLVSLALALTGLGLMFVENLNLGKASYMLIAALSGVFFGTNITFVRKLSSNYHPLQINLFNWFGVIAINLPISIFISERWFFTPLSSGWLANIALAICSLGASLSAVYGFKFVEVQKGSIILLSELVFGVIIGIAFYNEVSTLFTLLGSLFIFASLLLPNINALKLKGK